MHAALLLACQVYRTPHPHHPPLSPGFRGPLWEFHCPTSWPAGLKGVGVAVTVVFNATSTANCSISSFGGSASRLSIETALVGKKFVEHVSDDLYEWDPMASASPTSMGQCQVSIDICIQPASLSTHSQASSAWLLVTCIHVPCWRRARHISLSRVLHVRSTLLNATVGCRVVCRRANILQAVNHRWVRSFKLIIPTGLQHARANLTGPPTTAANCIVSCADAY